MNVNARNALVVMILGLLTACTHEPRVDSKLEMSVEEARTIVQKSQTDGTKGFASKIELTRIGLRMVYADGRSEMCRFDQITRLEKRWESFTLLHGCPQRAIPILGEVNGRRFISAVYVLKQDYLARTAPETPQQQAAFDAVVSQYRATQPQPALPESAMRYKAQAEFAVQQKRFDDAVDLYGEALKVTPWWPQGYYNRGLLLGELEAYTEAVGDLQKYIKLEPNAPNAQAVQTRIYQWESMAPKPTVRR